MKPGYATTEFWLTLLTNLAAVVSTVLVLGGHTPLSSDQASAFVAAAALVLATIGNAVYAWSRAHVKAAQSYANASN